MNATDAELARALYRAGRLPEPAGVGSSTFAAACFRWGTELLERNRAAEALPLLRRVAELRPDSSSAHNNLGNALRALDDDGGAEASYRRALQLSPQAAHVHRNLGTVLRARGAREQALECFARAAAVRPGWSRALQSLATTAMELGRWSVAREACELWLTTEPANVEALGLLSVALDELGETARASALIDRALLFRRRILHAPPPGFASVAAFNSALVAQVLAHPSLAVPEASEPRYHCPSLRLSGELCDQGAAAALRDWVAGQMKDYVDGLRRDAPAHPFVRGGPRAWQLVSWAAVLDGEGQLEPHVHYRSYVSAVYYAQVPARMGGGPQAGWFALGGGPSSFPCRVEREVLAVEPRAGTLLLFPSYFYHRTLPFTADERRVSLAFDSVTVGS